MKRPCRAPGCSTPAASQYAAYCPPHRRALRRHGAVDQRAITKFQLKPYLKLVRKRMQKNPESTAWVTLDSRWRAVIDHAHSVLAYFRQGKAGSRFELLAAQEVVKLSGDVQPRQVVEVTAAMVMMQELEPRRFRSDRAFWIQLARRVRGLTDLNYGEGWDNTRGRVRRSYREFTPRAAQVLGHWLAVALGVGGQHLVRLERADREKKAKERQELHDALSSLA
jgi:hypothetical protein